MKLSRRKFLHLSAAALPALTSIAHAEDFPTRPIRLVIPYPPGGVIDATARPWVERMKPLLGTMVIENIGGGSGEIGSTVVAHARPDGYTMLLANSSVMVINPLVGKRSYDPVASFDSVALVGHITQAFAVNPALPVQTLKELADYAKHNPGKLSFGTPGAGSLNHLTGELFKLLIGAPDIVHIPYRGSGPAIADLLGGQIPMAIPAVTGQLLQFHRTGKLRLLAITSPARLSAAPDIPTTGEAGMPDLVVRGTNWLCVPKGTPPAIITQVSQAASKAMADPELERIFLASGLAASPESSPEAAAQLLQSELARWKPIVERIGFKPD